MSPSPARIFTHSASLSVSIAMGCRTFSSLVTMSSTILASARQVLTASAASSSASVCRACLMRARMSSWMAHITLLGPSTPWSSRKGKSWFSLRR